MAIPGDNQQLDATWASAQPHREPASADDQAANQATSEATNDPTNDPFPTLDEAMRRHIEAALLRCNGRIEGEHGAARLLAIHANTLRSRMHKLGIRWERFRGRGTITGP